MAVSSEIQIDPPPMTERQSQVFSQITKYLRNREGPNKIIELGGRRSGKTFGVITGFLPFFFTMPMMFAFGAVTKKRTGGGWGEIVRYCRGMIKTFGATGWRFAPAEDGILESPVGASWQRLEFITPDVGRGDTYDGAIVDELQLVKAGVLHEFLPTLMTTLGLFCGLGTAPKNYSEWSESKWWIDIVMMDERERAEKKPDYMVFHHATTPNDIAFAIMQRDIQFGRRVLDWERYLYLGQKTLDELLYTIGQARYAREILVQLVEPTSGRIFPNFLDDRIGTYGFDPALGGELIIAVDKGEGEAWNIALLCQKYDRTIKPEWSDEPITESVYRIFKEVAIQEQTSSKQFLRMIIHRMPSSDATFFPDPNANQFAHDARNFGFPVIDSKVPVFDGNELVDECFRKKRIEVDSSCEVFIRQAKRYSKKINGDPEDVEVDGADALRYLIYNDAVRSGEVDYEDMEIETEINALDELGFGSSVGVLSLR